MKKMTDQQTDEDISFDLEIESCPCCGREGGLAHEKEMILITGAQAPRICRVCRAYLVTQNLLSMESLSREDLTLLGLQNVGSVERAARML